MKICADETQYNGRDPGYSLALRAARLPGTHMERIDFHD